MGNRWGQQEATSTNRVCPGSALTTPDSSSLPQCSCHCTFHILLLPADVLHPPTSAPAAFPAPSHSGPPLHFMQTLHPSTCYPRGPAWLPRRQSHQWGFLPTMPHHGWNCCLSGMNGPMNEWKWNLRGVSFQSLALIFKLENRTLPSEEVRGP